MSDPVTQPQSADAETDGYHSASPSLHDGKLNELDNVPEQSLDFTHYNSDARDYDTDHDYDADSAIDNESLIGDDTRSLNSTVTSYRYEHGRRYHAYKDGAYWVRNFPTWCFDTWNVLFSDLGSPKPKSELEIIRIDMSSESRDIVTRLQNHIERLQYFVKN
ncbi:hypothetical protein BT63DRAFT_15318 [Microthyrium microscopicum]|uniref:Uncharacterized protein n=1 Tax=Microthyrium microscopicum TaxID=703497 RepID=A0A6A6UU68_9PEZI|nr:hypothetical protein BT63DRAFT_15318 [Microthyrium microscopicum]